LADAWRAIGLIDTASHAHRLTFPTMLTAGRADPVCPADTIIALYDRLPHTRSLTDIAGQIHEYTQPFLHLAMAWFRLYL
jgi:cephalosporin-C deacetylase-like acetyl esterase